MENVDIDCTYSEWTATRRNGGVPRVWSTRCVTFRAYQRLDKGPTVSGLKYKS